MAVNHLWLRHFGQALVPSVFDFGRNGQPPSHPALLDWLAAEFMDRGWTHEAAAPPDRDQQRLPHGLHARTTANLAADPDNVYLWRMPPRRLEAEVVRDSIFYVAGKLDLTMGGPDIDHAQGLTVAAPQPLLPPRRREADGVPEALRRRRRDRVLPAASESIIPQQALALANSDLTARQARLLAARAARRRRRRRRRSSTAAFEPRAGAPADRGGGGRVRGVPETVRPATPCAGRESLVHVLMNHHDFVTVR